MRRMATLLVAAALASGCTVPVIEEALPVPIASAGPVKGLRWSSDNLTGDVVFRIGFELKEEKACELNYGGTVYGGHHGYNHLNVFEWRENRSQRSLGAFGSAGGHAPVAHVHVAGVVDTRERADYGPGSFETTVGLGALAGRWTYWFAATALEPTSDSGSPSFHARISCDAPMEDLVLEGGRKVVILDEYGFQGGAGANANILATAAYESEARLETNAPSVALVAGTGLSTVAAGTLRLLSTGAEANCALEPDQSMVEQAKYYGGQDTDSHLCKLDGKPGVNRVVLARVGAGVAASLHGILAGLHPMAGLGDVVNATG